MRSTIVLALTAACAALAACDSGREIPASSAPQAPDLASEPALETELVKLDAALICTEFTHPDKPPILLVHGTFTNGYEQYDWTYLPLLVERGYDVCAVSYPDRGLGDQQASAEYVVHALRTIFAQTGRKVAMIGHSQGATMPRWALKWWPSAREAVEDFVLQAGPNHGTTVAGPTGSESQNPLGMPAAFWQFQPASMFVTTLNRDDETPGEISYTNLYTQFDELVQPVTPVPTAALEFGLANEKVSNILLQELCPGRFVDHVTIGLTDRLAFELTLDAIGNPGPADLERAGGAALCGLAPIVPDQIVHSSAVTAMLGVLQQQGPESFPAFHNTTEEPPLKPYAQ